jgi:glycosyltransferase involved in cell wall biosynthesis
VEHGASLDPRRWRAIVGSFRERRHSVPVVREAERKNLPTFLIETQVPFSPLAIVQLRRQMKDRSIDLLVSHGYKANIVGHLAAAGTGTPHLAFVRGFTGEDLRVRFYESVNRWFLRRARHVACVSDGTRRKVLSLGLRPDRVVTVHNAVHRSDHPTAGGALRSDFNIPDQAPLLLSVGRLSREKGHRFLVSAVRILASRATDFHLVLVGDGRESVRLRNQVRAEGLEERVHFAGFRSDVMECLAAADILVNPSSTEGLPNAVLEAFAAGTPVVATDVGGVGELVISGRTGWLVRPDDPEAMAAALADALENPDRARAMAVEASRYVREVFSFERQADALMEIYDNIVEGQSCIPRS